MADSAALQGNFGIWSHFRSPAGTFRPYFGTGSLGALSGVHGLR
jgi:hypothetical protein